MGTQRRLLLIYPRSLSGSNARQKHMPKLLKRGGYLNAGLATIAGLTPGSFAIDIIDEDKQTVDYSRMSERYDIVGLTGFYFQVERARLIADQFRNEGSLVVAGGPGVSLAPDRWRSFCDVLIIGEAERIWPQFINDFLDGNHQSQYHETERFELSHCRLPDYSGFDRRLVGSYLCGLLQTSRGCPFDCEFCSAVIYSGKTMRYKSIDLIIEELEQLQRLGIEFVALADDNFSANRKKSKAILRALREWNCQQRRTVTFFAQLSIDTAKDEEFLELATEAGLNRVLIGIESPNSDTLREARKFQNVRTSMREGIKRFHEHGIVISGTSIVGFDNDSISTFQQHFDFLQVSPARFHFHCKPTMQPL